MTSNATRAMINTHVDSFTNWFSTVKDVSINVPTIFTKIVP